MSENKEIQTYMDGPDVVVLLKKKLRSEDVLDFHVLNIDTVGELMWVYIL